MQAILSDICTVGLEAAFPDIHGIYQTVQVAGNPKFGDYQYNAAHQVVKILKDRGRFLLLFVIVNKSLFNQCNLHFFPRFFNLINAISDYERIIIIIYVFIILCSIRYLVTTYDCI